MRHGGDDLRQAERTGKALRDRSAANRYRSAAERQRLDQRHGVVGENDVSPEHSLDRIGVGRNEAEALRDPDGKAAVGFGVLRFLLMYLESHLIAACGKASARRKLAPERDCGSTRWRLGHEKQTQRAGRAGAVG